ncbi:hypothetical protein NQ318_009436 [Aromia moschata]|uniref:Sarcoglycan alpha/epsilon second domain-containing protein n=1 Tax=Aromia moschata TaxID=1265417 RepID=A0AAV8Z8Y6_9CUCU|nr:hypothetical protein NQ318_009436 [Aromia moschata]
MVENMQSCPRKRTSVERLFRDAHFTLDWCSFRLIEDNNYEMHDSGANEKIIKCRRRQFKSQSVGTSFPI